MMYKSRSDFENLQVRDVEGLEKREEPRSDRERMMFSVFENVYVNDMKVDGNYTLSYEREHTSSHDNRLHICYAKYLTYKGISNKKTLQNMAKLLGCSENACWFVTDISIKNQTDLHFTAIVVDPNKSMSYEDSKERKRKWEELLPIENGPHNVDSSLQKIYYGAPGTGKSKKIRDEEENGLICHRTTFHPDTDYASFVGCYKPQMVKSDGEKKIEYAFEPQVFMDAYIKAWNDLDTPTCLVIEELNRGNCAQIFGDIFQLLDRDKDGFSKYPIIPDKTIQDFLNTKLNETAKNTYLVRYKPNDANVQYMALPPSLSIKATMNTSDQSLYPMDSAFKRRWDWEYVSISYKDIKWTMKINEKEYEGEKVVRGINKYIAANLHSADKQIGSHFIMPKNDGNEITFNEFRDKVLFYLFNDVFKDDDNFHNDFGGILMFEELFDEETKAEEKTINFIENFLV